MNFTSRTKSVGTSETLAISATAKRMEMRGMDVANLSIGQPDFSPPAEAIEAMIEYIRGGRFNYQPPQGQIQLRRAVASHFRRLFGLSVGPAHVLITTGAKQAIALAFQVLAEEGDEVIIPTPAWVSYAQLVRLVGATPVFVPSTLDEGFVVTAQAIESKITAKTKVIIINSPNNPTGAIIPTSELQAIARVIEKHELILVSDDIYASLNFSDSKVESIVKYVGDPDRIISIGGASKTYAMPGLRIGWAVGGLKIVEKMRDVLSQTVSCVSGPAQVAALAAIRGNQGFLDDVRDVYRRRARKVVDRLRAIPGIRLLEPKGAFYVLASFQEYVGTNYKGQPIRHTRDLAHFLLTEAHVAVTPGEAFHAPGFIRLSFATSDDVIDKGLDRIADFLSKLSR